MLDFDLLRKWEGGATNAEMTSPRLQHQQLFAVIRFMGYAALNLALVVSVIVAVLTGYVMLYFSGPRNYAPFWIQALPWMMIMAAPIAIFLRKRKRWWALLAIATQLSLLAYLSVFPLVFSWSSSNPWRFTP
jgi:hypothetical protein